MIKVDTIAIREFRGIRDLTLDLAGGNFAICGPNGTGKSGIVDALEFALTGNISRLSGSGTGGLSVKEHGPHVDSRNKPENAAVTLSISIPSLGKQVTIERTIKNANSPTITPDEEDIRAVINHILQHPEFTLSRRELIRYVLSEPGKRSKEVQALLRLDELETLRTMLQKIANAEEKAIKPLESTQREAEDQLARALNITKLLSAKLLAAANEKRAILGLPVILALEATTSIRDGLTTASGAPTVSRVAKTQALADLKTLREELKGITGEDFRLSCKAAAESIAELGKDAESLDGVARQDLLRSALELFDDHTCPVCGTDWEPEKFKAIVEAKLKHFDEVAARRAGVEKKLTPITERLVQFASTLTLVAKYGPLLSPPVDVAALQDHAATLTAGAGQTRKLLPLEDTTAALDSVTAIPADVLPAVGALDKAVAALPEPSKQDAARDFLTIGQERLETYRRASLKLKAAREKAGIARTVFEVYGKVTTEALEAIYEKVEEKFTALYRIINHEDEAAFEARLKPSIGKLGFDVDFYGRGFFPPGAYHSEGHQDGMGFCLYLALMSHLLGDRFTFSVLDDVLMSIDVGHRREVSKLLQEQFPNTQFILTTHDEIWLRHMKSAGLIQPKAFAYFRTWNVDHGPAEWNDRDVWEEIHVHLAKNDVSQGAAFLRHYLEHLSYEICHCLRARVEFRGDARFVLGDLLPSAIGSFRKRLKAGKAAAQSWGKKDDVKAIGDLETAFATAAAASNAEQWQVNTAVHYNQWASLHKNDFKPVVAAFRDLTDKFRCHDCSGLIYVVPDRGKPEALRCGCATINVNLVPKS